MSTTISPTEPPHRRHTFKDLYHERTHFQFIERSWRWALLSGILVLVSVVAFAVRGLNLGIDFEGGTQLSFTVKGGADAGKIRDVLDPLGLGDAKVLIVGGNDVRVQTKDLKPAEETKVAEALAQYAGIDAQKQISVDRVGPTWGNRVSTKALQALIAFFFVIAIYLTFRFEWRMALAALVAVLHDIIVTVGIYAITQFEVTPATVVAFLTILGFSLYDTVVVFDKIKENQARIGIVPGDTYSSMVNRSLNQVLMRSINTSIVALLPVASLLFVGTYVFGGLVLRDFALALFVGLLTGAYSSIFVATPVVAWLKEREPRNRALRERGAPSRSRAVDVPVPAPAKPLPTKRAPRRPATVTPAAEPPGDGHAVEAVDAVDAADAGPGTEVEEPEAPAPAPEAAPTPMTTTRGAANPRPRQQRGRKRR